MTAHKHDSGLSIGIAVNHANPSPQGAETPARARSGVNDGSFRTRLSAPVFFHTADGRRFTAVAKNLSVGGLGLQHFWPPFEVSEELSVRFTLPETDYDIEVKGVVVWSQLNAVAGIRFTEVSPSMRQVLGEWIATQKVASSRSPH